MTLPGALLLAALAADPGALPSGVHAVPIVEGTARVVLDGRPSDAPVRLPAGWYFTSEGYDRLAKVTAELQASVQTLQASADALRAPCAALPATPVVVQTQSGWSTKTVLVVLVVAVAVGIGAGVAIR